MTEENTEHPVEDESIADALTNAYTEAMVDIEPESDPEPEAEEVAVSPEGAAEQTEESVEEDSEDSEEPEEVFQAPEHWSSDLKEQFEALTPEAQSILIARDKEFQTGYQEKAQSITDITEAIEPWKEHLAQRGVSPEQAIRVLFAAQHSVDQNPLQGILQIAQNYGVLDQLKAQFVPKEDDDFTDPEVKALKQEIAELRGNFTNIQQGAQKENAAAVNQIIETFASEKTASGELAHPYFDKVKELMAPHVGKGDSMEAAYEKVVWTIPEYREQAMKASGSTTDAEKAAKVKKAKKAARTVKPSQGADSTESDEDNLSIGDDLRKAFRQLSA